MALPLSVTRTCSSDERLPMETEYNLYLCPNHASNTIYWAMTNEQTHCENTDEGSVDRNDRKGFGERNKNTFQPRRPGVVRVVASTESEPLNAHIVARLVESGGCQTTCVTQLWGCGETILRVAPIAVGFQRSSFCTWLRAVTFRV